MMRRAVWRSAALAAVLGVWVVIFDVLVPQAGVGRHTGVPVAVTHGLRAAWVVTREVLAALLVAAAGVLVSRTVARRQRRYLRLRVIPARADQADAEQIARLLGVWHQLLLRRWWSRLFSGQPGLALEVRTADDGEGDLSGHLSIVCPVDDVSAVEGGLLACYRDAQLVFDAATPPPPGSTLLRLKKRATFVRALRTLDDQQPAAVDAVLRQMASAGAPAVLQFALSPAPLWFDRYARWRFRREERSFDGLLDGRPVRSELLSAELERALRAQHRPLFFTDIRIAAPTPAVARAVAGVVCGESVAENGLVVRHMRPWSRAPLYRQRLHAAVANPVAAWRRGVLSCTELATLWHLPSPGLRTVRIERSPLPRIPAPPEISRDPEFALARDERGLVGIRPQDKSDGLGLIGGQKTGKTSLLCRTVQADARDPDCAMIVLMPKPGDALKALSMVPGDRRVHYLDLERPEFGINPLLARGEPAMIADKVVEAFRDVNMEGDIRGSSDRYLRQAAQAAIGASRSGAVDGPPTLWHMYRMLLPAEEAFREHVVNAIMPDPRFVDTATFFGRELPFDLQNAAGQTVAKLDAPRNKLLRLMVESLDKVLRHPRQLSLDDLVRDRDVLIVDGKMGTFGADNCRVMMQFILNSLYGTLQRQQQLPEAERVRVALKVDEAHLILNESFADALATLRSAGLEVVAAWQYGKQITDEKIRAGMMSLLRQRCMFSMGESEDAREMSDIAMAVYADMIRPDPESRQNLRVAPDTIFNLPNHHALCSWISDGARAPSFLIETIPLAHDAAIVEHHLRAQRERGGFVPDRMPDPLPDLNVTDGRDLSGDLSADPGPAGAVAIGSAAAVPQSVSGFDAELAELLREAGAATGDGEEEGIAAETGPPPPARPKPGPSRPTLGAPETYTELDLDGVRGLIWQDVAVQPPEQRPEPTHRELAILAALWSYRVMFATQIHRRWWSDSSLRAAQQGLNRMLRAGWVRRFKFRLEERGAQQSVYLLTEEGFAIVRGRMGQHGPYVDGNTRWREPRIDDPRRLVRDLHVNGWVLALERMVGRRMEHWRGQNESRLEPPRRKLRGEWVPMRPQDLVLGTNTRLRDLEVAEFEPLTPDAVVELRIPRGDSVLRFDLLVEIDRARSEAATAERLRRYDGLVAGWAGTLERYRGLRTPPAVVFVAEDEPARAALCRLADRVVVAAHAKPGAPESEWRRPSRRAMFFVAERDIHEGSLRALALPEHPPELRVALGGPDARACRPREVSLIDPRLLGRS